MIVDEHPRQLAQDLGQEFNDSVTATPLHTRAHSPFRHLAFPDNLEVTEANMERLNTIFQQREAENVKVAVADGSATVPAKEKLIYLAIYFLLNLGLTLYNKAVMIKVCLLLSPCAKLLDCAFLCSVLVVIVMVVKADFPSKLSYLTRSPRFHRALCRSSARIMLPSAHMAYGLDVPLSIIIRTIVSAVCGRL